MQWTVYTLLLAAVLPGSAPAEEQLSAVEFYAAYETVRPGDRLPVAIQITVEEGWHTYAEEPGDSGMPPSIQISGVDGLEISGWRFPPHQTFTDEVGTSYGYEHQVVLLSEVRIPETAVPGTRLELSAEVSWMICRDICVFQKGARMLSVEVGTVSSGPSRAWTEMLNAGRWENRTGGVAPGKENR